MAISLSQNGTTTYISNSPSDKVLVATAGGVVSIERSDQRQWRVAQKSLSGHHISSLIVEPSSGIIFAGVHEGTVFASMDGGNSWQRRDNGIFHNHVFCLNYVNSAGQIRLYAGTEPAHLFTSEDLGKSWYELPAVRSVASLPRWTFPAPPHVAHVKNVTFDPQNPNVLYVSVEQGGLLKSVDGGASFKDLKGFYEDVHRLLIRPSDPHWFYVTGGEGLYRSRDGGESWEHLTTRQMRVGYPDAFLMHPYREDLMFMAGAIVSPSYWHQTKMADPRIARTRDAGNSWELLHEGFPEHMTENIEAMMMEVWDDSFALFAGTTAGNIFYSDDGGERWTRIVEGLPAISKHGHYRLLQRVAG